MSIDIATPHTYAGQARLPHRRWFATVDWTKVTQCFEADEDETKPIATFDSDNEEDVPEGEAGGSSGKRPCVA